MLDINYRFCTKSEGFSQCFIIICKIVFLDFVNRLNYEIIKLHRFGTFILLLS